MVKKLVILFLLLFPGSLSAGNMIAPKFGVEWGFGISLYQSYHYNFLTEDYMRVDERGTEWMLHMTGLLLGNVGCYFGEKLSLDLYCGSQGIRTDERVVPLTLRTSYYMRGWRNDGEFIFVEGGVGFRKHHRTTEFVKLGYGHRMKLSEHISLNFMFFLQACFDQPKVIDRYTGQVVPPDMVRLSEAVICSPNFSFSLGF